MNSTPATTTDRPVAVGDDVTPFVREAGLPAWNRYAAVNAEFVDIHMDDAAGQAAGFSGAIGMGNLIWAWLHAAVETWLDDRGTLLEIDCRFRRPALKGDVITCTGTVESSEDAPGGGTVFNLVLWAENQSGEKVAPGTARVLIPGPPKK